MFAGSNTDKIGKIHQFWLRYEQEFGAHYFGPCCTTCL